MKCMINFNESLKKMSGKNNHNSKKVCIFGRIFDTKSSASNFFSVFIPTITNFIKRKDPFCYDVI